MNNNISLASLIHIHSSDSHTICENERNKNNRAKYWTTSIVPRWYLDRKSKTDKRVDGMSSLPKNDLMSSKRTPSPAWETFGEYFETKKRKLRDDFSRQSLNSTYHRDIAMEAGESIDPMLRTLFEGISIFVTGYTNPSSTELRHLMIMYGGRHELYYSRERVTHIIASQLPRAKVLELKSMKQPPLVVHPTWITKSIDSKKKLPVSSFILPEMRIAFQATMSPFMRSLRSSASSRSVQPTDDYVGLDSKSFESNISGNAAACLHPSPKTKEAEEIRDGHLCAAIETFKSPIRTDENLDSASFSIPSKQRIENRGKEKISSSVDEDFVQHYFASSRLHHIGSWRSRFQELVSSRNDSSSARFGHQVDYDEDRSDSRIIVHIDMDCFFASVVLRNRPDLKETPVAVAHSDHGSSEVSAANYKAREFGIHSGMFMSTAKSLCANLTVLPYDFEAFEKVSLTLYSILFEWSAQVQAVSCDEAYIDISGSPDPEQTVLDIRNQIWRETQCPASAGIGPNRLLARLSTKRAKPNGQRMWKGNSDEDKSWLLNLDVSELPGVGWSLSRKLNDANIRSCQDLRSRSLAWLQSEFGAKTGELLYELCRGIDISLLTIPSERKSLGVEVNWGVRFSETNQVFDFLRKLVLETVDRMTREKMVCRSVAVKAKKKKPNAQLPSKFLGHGPCTNHSRSLTLSSATNDLDILFRSCKQLYIQLEIQPEDLRGLGVSVGKLSSIDESEKPKNSRTTNSIISRLNTSSNARDFKFDQDPSLELPSSSQWDQEYLNALPSEIQVEFESLRRQMKQNHSEDGDEQKNVPRQRPRRGKGQNDVVGRLRGSTLKNLFENRTAERKDESTTVDELVSLGIDPHVFFELPCSVRKQILEETTGSKSSVVNEFKVVQERGDRLDDSSSSSCGKVRSNMLLDSSSGSHHCFSSSESSVSSLRRLIEHFPECTAELGALVVFEFHRLCSSRLFDMVQRFLRTLRRCSGVLLCRMDIVVVAFNSKASKILEFSSPPKFSFLFLRIHRQSRALNRPSWIELSRLLESHVPVHLQLPI